MRILNALAALSMAALATACSSSSSPGGGSGTVADGGGDSGESGDAGPPATFTQVYTQVIAAKCSPCHTTSSGTGVSVGMLDMTSQSAAFMNLVNTAAAGSACAGKGTRVVPGKPDSSVFYLKVSLDDPSPCGEKMPLGRAPLSAAETAMIESWINGGAKND